MIGFRIRCAALILLLCAAASAAVSGCAASACEALPVSAAGFEQPEEQQLQATRLLNMLASMVRERSPFLAGVLVFFGMVLKFITNRTVLRVLLWLLLVGIASSAALVAWASWKRRKAGLSAPNSARVRRPIRPLSLPPQTD